MPLNTNIFGVTRPGNPPDRCFRRFETGLVSPRFRATGTRIDDASVTSTSAWSPTLGAARLRCQTIHPVVQCADEQPPAVVAHDAYPLGAKCTEMAPFYPHQ
jgi:hypothetical protein